MKASNKKFKAFLKELHDALPPGFEISIADEGISSPATAYAFTAFMRGGSAENCAIDLVTKIGIEDEDEANMDDTTIDGWASEGGSI